MTDYLAIAERIMRGRSLRPADTAEVVTAPTQEQIDQAGRILAQADMRLMELNGVVTVGIWRDQDTAAVRAAIGLFHPDGVPIRYLDDPDIPAKYRSGRVQPSGQASLKGECVELWRDGRRFFLVADDEDALEAMRRFGARRGEVWTCGELELVASIPDQATRDEVESFKRQLDGCLSRGAAGKCVSAAEWQARMLNQMFLEQGVTGQPAKITAKTVRHGSGGNDRQPAKNRTLPRRQPGGGPNHSGGSGALPRRHAGMGRHGPEPTGGARGAGYQEGSVKKKDLVREPVRVRPEGPRNCWRTRNVAASCDVCGARPEVVHTPMHGKGFRCPEHCENCGPAESKPEAPGECA